MMQHNGMRRNRSLVTDTYLSLRIALAEKRKIITTNQRTNRYGEQEEFIFI